MKKFYLWSLLLCLALGSITIFACGEDEQEVTPKSETEAISAREILGTWYVLDNEEEKISMDVISFTSETEGMMVEMKAKADNNFQPEIYQPMAFNYTFDGKHMKMLASAEGVEHVMEGDVYKQGGKYYVARYEDGKATEKVQLTRVSNTQEAQEAFRKAIEGRINGSDATSDSTYVKPNPTDSTYVKPNPTDSTYVKPNPTDSTYVKPNPTDSTYVEPNPTDSTYVKPTPTDSTYVKPNPTDSTGTTRRF